MGLLKASLRRKAVSLVLTCVTPCSGKSNSLVQAHNFCQLYDVLPAFSKDLRNELLVTGEVKNLSKEQKYDHTNKYSRWCGQAFFFHVVSIFSSLKTDTAYWVILAVPDSTKL